jgi:hypothetical protein
LAHPRTRPALWAGTKNKHQTRKGKANMNEKSEVILTQNGEVTELAAPSDFGKGMEFIDPTQMPDLDEAEVGINIQPEYFEFKAVGDTFRGIFNGISEITTKDQQNVGQYKKIPAVVMQDKTGVKLNAGANLVSQLRNLRPGTAIQVRYKGEEKSNNGKNVKVFDVHLLNVPRVNVPERPALVAPKSEPELPKFTNTQRATEYWTMVYSPRWKFTEQEGKDHLAAFHNDFDAAIKALEEPSF